MKWKTKRVEQEWHEVLVGCQPSLMLPVALLVDALSIEYAGREAIVTGIHRTTLEQADLIVVVNDQRLAAGKQPWSPTRKSVHQYWRGIDFRSWIYTEDQRTKIIGRVNEVFQYGRNLKVLAYHAAGTAGHLHGQVPHGENWRT